MTTKTRTFKEDEEVGKNAEVALKDRISNYFNDDLELAKFKFSKYDYQGKTGFRYELKNRLVLSTHYPTTMIAVNKRGPNTYFLFHFLDGKLFYIKYDRDVFNDVQVKEFCRTPRPDHIDKPQDYYYIPMEKLTEII